MNRPVRVLSVTGDLGFGGSENRLLSLARNINRDRFDLRVLSITPVTPHREEAWAMLNQYRAAGIEVLQLKTRNQGIARVSRLASRVRQLCRIVRELEIDIIDTHCELAALTGTLAGLLTRRPRIATLYHPHPLLAPRWWGIAEQIIFTKTNLLITDSSVRAGEIRDAALFRKPEVAVIPNGIPQPRSNRSRVEMRRYFGLPEDLDVRVVGQISTLRESKGHLVLLEAMKTVFDADCRAALLVVGYEKDDPGFKERVERRAAELGIADRVRIAGYPGSIADAWNVIDVHVHASLFDSLPNAIIEGMSLGKPAVVTAVGGVPDAVANGESALVVPPGDAAALSKAIQSVLDDPVLEYRLGYAAFSRYHRDYRPDLMARRLESRFAELIDRGLKRIHLWNESPVARSS